MMEALTHTINDKDSYTKGHSVRVAKYFKMLAEKMTNMGTQFDPLIAKKMLEIIDEDKDYTLHE